MRQIEGMVNFLIGVALNKKSISYEISQDNSNSNTDMLYGHLNELIDKGKINEAENLLFEKIDTDDKRYLEFAIDFYSRLNKLDDFTLENSGFTRKEIEEGLRDAANIFGISII
jgi:enoyl-[acyl-carrier-protein] reductase (NADH)